MNEALFSWKIFLLGFPWQDTQSDAKRPEKWFKHKFRVDVCVETSKNSASVLQESLGNHFR